MKKKIIFGSYSLLSLLCLGGLIWFMAEWISNVKNLNDHVVEVVIMAGIMLVLLALVIIFAYMGFAVNNNLAILKGLNSTIGILFLIAGIGLILISSYNIYNHYTGIITSLTTGIITGVLGVAGLLICVFMFHKNASIKETEDKVKAFNKEPEKIETFEDKKMNTTCKFCGCRLKENDIVCPNCNGKLK